MNDHADEERSLLRFLRDGEMVLDPEDDLHKRIVRSFRFKSSSHLDRAVLVRQLLRRMSLRDGRNVPVELAQGFASSVGHVAQTVGLRARGRYWYADEWTPDWLDSGSGTPDGAALAGTSVGQRFVEDRNNADPFFEAVTGYSTYRTAGQRAACRAVISAPYGATLIGMLPTGSGKTEIALCLAARRQSSVTVVVVPTVALAYDFERRFRVHFARQNPRIKPDDLHFAWTGSTSQAVRAMLRTRVMQGQQPILVTSPESLTKSLRQTLLQAAGAGRLLGFVVDEAHLVTQWGRDFRPEFRVLADLRRDIFEAARAAGDLPPITLLLSATIGDSELQDLAQLFGAPGPLDPIMANALRAEPDIWIAHATDPIVRDQWVVDTLMHSARPAVLYVTQPAVASKWMSRLSELGFRNIAQVTGNTPGEERAAVLNGLRSDLGTSTGIDVVVATAAFGLGIDYPHIRTVIHACLPETVDRWYQELGRGGRDGHASAAFLLTSSGDRQEAASLGTTVLRPATALARWNDLWDHRRTIGNRTFIDLEGSRGVGRGDYNRRWNAQLVQGLVELGDLRREQFDLDDIHELQGTANEEASEWIAVSLTTARLGEADFWADQWEPWQYAESSKSRVALERVLDVANERMSACSGIAGAYTPSERSTLQWGSRLQFMEPAGPCGRCPHCRAVGFAPNTDPPPAPAQEWSVAASDTTELVQFARMAGAVNGVVLLTYDAAEYELAEQIATGLMRVGARHFTGGVRPSVAVGDPPIFVDDPPASPVDLTPFSSLSVFGRDSRVSGRWLSRRTRARFDSASCVLIDTLLVPVGTLIRGRRVGRDLPAVRASTAAEMVGAK